jgi:hypothetical protein
MWYQVYSKSLYPLNARQKNSILVTSYTIIFQYVQWISANFHLWLCIDNLCKFLRSIDQICTLKRQKKRHQRTVCCHRTESFRHKARRKQCPCLLVCSKNGVCQAFFLVARKLPRAEIGANLIRPFVLLIKFVVMRWWAEIENTNHFLKTP